MNELSISYSFEANNTFYECEIQRALDWLYRIRDEHRYGWAWVQFIQPNEQNTAEVIYTFAENEEWLKNHPDAIYNIVQSINYWLIDTTHPKISIDYCWVLRALQKIRESTILYSKIDRVSLENAVNTCIKWLCDHYVEDGDDCCGWNDNSTEMLNVIRTSLSVLCITNEIDYMKTNAFPISRINLLQNMADRSLNWLIKLQNPDGGWGNIESKYIDQKYQLDHHFTIDDLHYQCDSNPASTGYVMLAIASNPDYKKKYTYQVTSFQVFKK